jgi:hypothetical protein
MAWLPTPVDPYFVGAWCVLTGEAGKYVMGIIGLGGLGTTIRSLYTLPDIVETDIITIRNSRLSYRRRTRLVGWIAGACLTISTASYLVVTMLFALLREGL